MSTAIISTDAVADRLVEIHERPFGGKPKGRYRIASKLVRRLAGRRRLYEDDIRDLSRAMLERGFILIDMESFFVVTATNSFLNYRRANEDSIA